MAVDANPNPTASASALRGFFAGDVWHSFRSSPVAMLRHRSHSSQGVGVGPLTQFSALARMRAAVVLPTPRVPVKR